MIFGFDTHTILGYYMVLFAIWECYERLKGKLPELKEWYAQIRTKDCNLRKISPIVVIIMLAFAPPLYYGYSATHQSNFGENVSEIKEL